MSIHLSFSYESASQHPEIQETVVNTVMKTTNLPNLLVKKEDK